MQRLACHNEHAHYIQQIDIVFSSEDFRKRDGCGSSVGSASAWYAGGRGFDPHIRQHSFLEFGHEIISTAILFLPLIQEGQLSVSVERIHALSTDKLPRRLA